MACCYGDGVGNGDERNPHCEDGNGYGARDQGTALEANRKAQLSCYLLL